MPATKKQNRPAAGAAHARDQKPKPPGCRSGPCPRQLRLDRHRSVGGMAPSYGPGNRVSPTASTPVCSTSARKPARWSICRTVREPGQSGCA